MPDPFDFTKKSRAPRPATGALEDKLPVVDMHEGKMQLPGEVGERDMVGVSPAILEEQMAKHADLSRRLLTDIRSVWQCTVCKRQMMGADCRVRVVGAVQTMVAGRWELVGGTEMLVCRDQTCNGEVIRVREPRKPVV